MTTTTTKSRYRAEDDHGIAISDNVRLRRVDPSNIVLEHRAAGSWRIVGYYPSVALACDALSTRHLHLLMGDERGAVRDLVRAIRELAAALRANVGERAP